MVLFNLFNSHKYDITHKKYYKTIFILNFIMTYNRLIIYYFIDKISKIKVFKIWFVLKDKYYHVKIYLIIKNTWLDGILL